MSVASSSSLPPLLLVLLVIHIVFKSIPCAKYIKLSLSSSSSCSTATRDPQFSLSDLNHDHPRPVFPAGPQPRSSTPSVPCRTSTATIHTQCSLPDLNDDHPRPVFPAGPQQRPSTPSDPCRTSTATIHAQCPLRDLNHDHPRPVIPAGPQPRPSIALATRNISFTDVTVSGNVVKTSRFLVFLTRCIILCVCEVIRHLSPLEGSEPLVFCASQLPNGVTTLHFVKVLPLLLKG